MKTKIVINQVISKPRKFENKFEFVISKPWTQKQLLSEEFNSLGFYIKPPSNEFEEIFHQLKIISYERFFNNNEKEGLVAGTIMSIQEKSAKGTLCYYKIQ